ncbi:MAG: hypothetical protein AB1634_18965, partial [Thermodesulfobacteriota bacterium]
MRSLSGPARSSPVALTLILFLAAALPVLAATPSAAARRAAVPRFNLAVQVYGDAAGRGNVPIEIDAAVLP